MLVITAVGVAAANGPELMVYSGSIPQGVNQGDGFYDISFSIYTSEQGGSALWSETQNVFVYQGTFGVYLGAVQKLNLAFDVPYWVGVKAGGKEDIWPLTGAGYPIDVNGGVESSTVKNGTSTAVAADEVKSANIKEADGTTGQNTNSGSGIKTGHIQNAAVTTAKIKANAVTTGKIADGAVTDTKITGPITASKIGFTGLNADLVDGLHAGAFSLLGHNHDAAYINAAGDTMTGALKINSGPIDTTTFTGLKLQYSTSGEGAIMSSFDDGIGYLSFYTKEAATMPVTRRMVIDRTGKVGIGTASPAANLHLNTGTFLLGTSSAKQLRLRDTGAAVDLESLGVPLWVNYTTGQDVYLMGGKVGIGTATPGAKLHLKGAGWPNSFIYLDTTAAAQDSGLRFYENGTVKSHLYWSASAANLKLYGSGASGIDINSSGKIGIGTATPGFGIDAERSTGYTYAKFGINQPLYMIDLPAEIGFNAYFNGGYKYGKGSTAKYGGSIQMNPTSGDFNVQVSTAPGNTDGAMTMKNVLSIRQTGDVYVGVLHVTGGADLAEPFDVRERSRIKPGMLVAIDPDDPGKLRLTESAYDRTVAGIVSGANGIKPGVTLKQEGTSAEGNIPVALTGRVYCMADASRGAIKPGDLLTSSDIPGYAMKAIDHGRAQGAIIGKAMSSLSEGQGMVLVLVTLQ